MRNKLNITLGRRSELRVMVELPHGLSAPITYSRPSFPRTGAEARILAEPPASTRILISSTMRRFDLCGGAAWCYNACGETIYRSRNILRDIPALFSLAGED